MDPHRQFSTAEIDGAVGRFTKRIDDLEKCVKWLVLTSTGTSKDSVRIREPDKKAPSFTCCVKHRFTQRSEWLFSQQGVGGARPRQYFLWHGCRVKLDFVNQLWHPIRIRVLQIRGPDTPAHDVLPGAEIVLGSFDNQNGTHTRCVEIGRVVVHQKHSKMRRNEVVLRIQATRLVHECKNRWKIPNLICEVDVECLVVINTITTTTTTNDGDVDATVLFSPSSIVLPNL